MIKLKEILDEIEVSRELLYHIENNITLDECVFRFGSVKYFALMNEARALMNQGNQFDSESKALLETNIGKFDLFEGEEVPLDFPMMTEKKDKPIGKPKRGGPKAYYVYVRDPKTKKVKKVTFGSGGLRAKINNPKARKAFAARHKCSTKTDRTKASYWSCRLPRYAKQLGLSVKNPGGFW